jgi:hypothetical protein
LQQSWILRNKIKNIDNRTEYMPDQSTVEYSILWVSYVIALWIIRKTSKSWHTTLKLDYDNIRRVTYKGNNKITELRTILQRESQNS